MYPPLMFQNIKFAIREVTAFVGHSFAEKDKDVVEQLTQVLTKLGVRCDSGLRAEASSVSEKVRERISAADIFVGIFTRRDKIRDDQYSTSPWVVEEKAAAISARKALLLFVEEGVSEFGGLQGDYEYIPFDRMNFAPALIRAMDYVLSLTSVPFNVTIDGPNKVSLKVGADKPLDQQVDELRKFVATRPTNIPARISFAKLLAQSKNYSEAQTEWAKLAAEFPNDPNVHHETAHYYEARGDLTAALLSFQRALDLNPSDYKNNRCYARCLYQSARPIGQPVVKQSTLNKAKRLLERAASLGGESCRAQIDGDLFNVNEALTECVAT